MKVSLKIKNLFRKYAVFALLITLLPGILLAEEDTNAPQILTTDLIRKQILKDPEKVVSFVFVDENNITEILINGVSQNFKNSDTVLINKKFVFEAGKNIVEVIVVDQAGNSHKKTFLVGLGEEVDLEKEIVSDEETKKDEKAKKYLLKTSFALSYELDDNPSNDFSTPVAVKGVDIKGVVDDSEQADYRSVGNLTLALGTGAVNGFIGGIKTTYSKQKNKSINSQAAFVGVGLRLKYIEDDFFVLNYLLTDVNVGGNDFSQTHSLTPGMLFNSKDEEGIYKHLLTMNYTAADFSDQADEDSPSYSVKWEYHSKDADLLDDYRFQLAYGYSSSGTKDSELTFTGLDFDWHNRWETGLKWDLGFGLQYKKYATAEPLTNEFLGNTRVDVPIRFSNTFGWQFNPSWKLLLNYKYSLNISNKLIYVRTISGLILKGAF